MGKQRKQSRNATVPDSTSTRSTIESGLSSRPPHRAAAGLLAEAPLQGATLEAVGQAS